MTISYMQYAPDQALLLRPTLQEWLPEGHLAYFISDTVDGFELSAFHERYAGGGARNQPFHPAMMVKVLIYGYATGVFSSRKIARKLHEDIAFRVLGADNFPAHRTISDFRANHLEALAGLFVQVVKLAQECGLVKLGTIAIDGTKVKANASRHKAMSYKRMLAKEQQLNDQIEELLEKARSIDEAEREEPQLDIPAEIQRREKRLATISAAKERLEQRQREMDEAKGRSEGDNRRPRNPDGSSRRGPPFKRDFGVPKDDAQDSFTDPDSRIMKHSSGAFEHSYNAQNAVDAQNQIIVAAELSQCAADNDQLTVVLSVVEENLGSLPEQVLADTGYKGEDIFAELAEKPIDVIVSVGREGKKVADIDSKKYPHTAKMAEHLKTDSAKQAYSQRKHIVEPPNGWIKRVLGFREFSMRGYEKCQCEWKLITASLNLRRMAAFKVA